MKIRPVGAELFHAERQTDRRDETNSHISQIANAPKNEFREQCTTTPYVYFRIAGFSCRIAG
jgi:hypothetical protein